MLQGQETYILIRWKEGYQDFVESRIFPEAVMGVPEEDIVEILEPVVQR